MHLSSMLLLPSSNLIDLIRPSPIFLLRLTFNSFGLFSPLIVEANALLLDVHPVVLINLIFFHEHIINSLKAFMDRQLSIHDVVICIKCLTAVLVGTVVADQHELF